MSSIKLNRMKCPTVIVTKSDKHTWVKHKKPLRHIPRNTDVCIACSISDIRPMLKKMPKNARPYWWCRLLETYQMPKDKILREASKVNVLVNSLGLYSWFRKYGIDSDIVYQGYDRKWFDIGPHRMNSVGFLVSSKKRKRFDVIEKIIKTLGDQKRYYGFGLDINRAIKKVVKKKFSGFTQNAGYADLSKLYNQVGIWVSTSTREGLHNVPLEAALCGCAVVYPDTRFAGCADHCIDGKTAWRYSAGDAVSAAETIISADRSRVEAHKDYIKNNIGDRETCMKKLVTILERK